MAFCFFGSPPIWKPERTSAAPRGPEYFAIPVRSYELPSKKYPKARRSASVFDRAFGGSIWTLHCPCGFPSILHFKRRNNSLRIITESLWSRVTSYPSVSKELLKLYHYVAYLSISNKTDFEHQKSGFIRVGRFFTLRLDSWKEKEWFIPQTPRI